ncbi:MAG: glycoside hydrolase family 28 protein, partial [Acidobacteriota bacterium]|nr:glycoside hydrolase family 28 protein [Acidobacteriota bacterium]
DIRISDLRATGAKQAFAVSSHDNSPLKDFVLRNWDVEAATAGSIRNAVNWKMDGVRVKTADGSIVRP